MIIKPKLVPAVRKKHSAKQAKVILEGLVKMHNLYLAHSGDGGGYKAARKLWDRKTDAEMTWDRKVKFYMEHVLEMVPLHGAKEED